MPYKDKDDAKKYREAHREELSEKKKIYYENNKSKIGEYNKVYYENNKSKLLENSKIYTDSKHGTDVKKIYRKSEEYKKSSRISHWKQSGLLCEDFDLMYKHYINTPICDNCKIELTIDKRTTKTTRCLDHDHKTGLFRNVLCHSCNTKRR